VHKDAPRRLYFLLLGLFVLGEYGSADGGARGALRAHMSATARTLVVVIDTRGQPDGPQQLVAWCAAMRLFSRCLFRAGARVLIFALLGVPGRIWTSLVCAHSCFLIFALRGSVRRAVPSAP